MLLKIFFFFLHFGTATCTPNENSFFFCEKKYRHYGAKVTSHGDRFSGLKMKNFRGFLWHRRFFHPKRMILSNYRSYFFFSLPVKSTTVSNSSLIRGNFFFRMKMNFSLLVMALRSLE